MWRKILFTVLVAGLLLSLAAQSDKSYSADRFNVAVRIQEGGSLDVHETVTFRFVGGPFTYAYRELLTDHTDGITDIAAGIDGRPLPAGTTPGHVEISGRDPIRVTWHFEPTSNSSRTFDLSYRMLGVVAQEKDADLVLYQVLPDGYDYTIDSSRITFSYPRTAELLEAPVLTGPGTITVDDEQIVVTAQDLQPDQTLVVKARFEPGSLITSPPTWQAEQETQNRQGWLWLIAALVLFVGGVALVVRLTGPYRRTVATPVGLAYEPPGGLAPAVAGILRASGAKPNWNHALGTLFDLAARDVLIIEELPKKRFGSRDFVIHQIGEPDTPRPHEENLLRLLFETKKGDRQDEVKLSSLGRAITSARWKHFAGSLEAELKAAGLVSTARKQARRRLTAAGIALLALDLAALIPLILWWINDFGLWSLAIFASLLLVSLVWITVAAGVSVLSPAGQALSAEWERFYQFLQQVSKGRAGLPHPEAFEQFLPYAAAYGLLHTWARRFQKQGWTQIPPYFQALSTVGEDGMAAFVAMTAASSSSGGAGASAGAAGAAGAGAAGGGASGAG